MGEDAEVERREREIEHLRRELAEARSALADAEQLAQSLDEFAYATSHDLRAPLRGITNLTTWIEEDLGTLAPKKVREHVSLLKNRASRMDRLITGLLQLARVGRARPRFERVDVTELLHETIDLLSPSEASRVMIIGAMPMMVAERYALQSVFLNLIGNALQHAGRKDVVVRISASERSDDVEFTVSDNGIGIAPEHCDRVWQPFQTLVSRDVTDTSGLGLAIVKKQVERDGGRAWIEPGAREGATFKFTWTKKPI
jgi:signal transduction histidine kinase